MQINKDSIEEKESSHDASYLKKMQKARVEQALKELENENQKEGTPEVSLSVSLPNKNMLAILAVLMIVLGIFY